MRFAYAARSHAYSRTGDYLFAQIIPYIGSKRKLLPVIARAVARTGCTAAAGGLPPIKADRKCGDVVHSPQSVAVLVKVPAAVPANLVW